MIMINFSNIQVMKELKVYKKNDKVIVEKNYVLKTQVNLFKKKKEKNVFK